MRALAITHLDRTGGYTFDRYVEKLADTTMGEDASLGDIYRACQKEFGRCTGKVYVDEMYPVGWLFVRRMAYDDVPQTFLQETWVVVGEYRPGTEETVIPIKEAA